MSNGVSPSGDRAGAAAQSNPQAVSSIATIPDAGNLALWNALGKTDPRHTKQFSRAGGFKGTALKPIWTIKRLTEQFGPVGIGWGMETPSFQVVPGENRELLVYCTVTCWHTSPSNTFVGVGGDKVVTYIKANSQYNRPERWESDDEAFKKAFTDAVGNAFKFVGVGADIHMGQFEDSKYVRETAAEFAASEREGGHSQTGAVSPQPEPEAKTRGLAGPYTSKAKLFAAFNAVQREVMACGDDDMLTAYLSTDEAQTVLEQCKRDAPHYLEGGDPAPEDFEPLYTRIARMRREWQMENA